MESYEIKSVIDRSGCWW